MLTRIMASLKKVELSATKTTSYEKWTKTQLISRIQELESGLTPQIADKQEVSTSTTDPNATPQTKKRRVFDFSKHSTRFVAFRFAYLGWNYNGLNFQYEPTPLPTVEEEILQAMTKARLVTEADPGCCDFSRCGRTDKGVSALNQVISLKVRSSLSAEEQKDAANDQREIPYLTILNALLPADIRITAVCLRPLENFNARFSCLYRHYKYLFKGDGLDIELMKDAASRYEGVHDFRNFCKIDGSKQITNHSREIHSAKILHIKDDLYCFDLQGSAFLWHQVRCMVAILFLVGQKHESPSVVDDLMSPEIYPRKPVYEMANDIPLVLYDCAFPEMEWLNSYDDFGKTHHPKLIKEISKFNGMHLDHHLKSAISDMMAGVYLLQTLLVSPGDGGFVNTGDGKGRNFKSYVPISKRELGESVEVVNRRHREKKEAKQKRSEE